MLGDVIGGFAMWAPWTFAIKGIMALIVGLVIYAFRRKDGEQTSPKRKLAGEIVGMVLAGTFMTFGYYVAEGVMYGNWAAPLLGVPWNIGQFVVGLVIAIVIQKALERTALKEYFL
jgi:uncharacterized membrane protein